MDQNIIPPPPENLDSRDSLPAADGEAAKPPEPLQNREERMWSGASPGGQAVVYKRTTSAPAGVPLYGITQR